MISSNSKFTVYKLNRQCCVLIRHQTIWDVRKHFMIQHYRLKDKGEVLCWLCKMQLPVVNFAWWNLLAYWGEKKQEMLWAVLGYSIQFKIQLFIDTFMPLPYINILAHTVALQHPFFRNLHNFASKSLIWLDYEWSERCDISLRICLISFLIEIQFDYSYNIFQDRLRGLCSNELEQIACQFKFIWLHEKWQPKVFPSIRGFSCPKREETLQHLFLALMKTPCTCVGGSYKIEAH